MTWTRTVTVGAGRRVQFQLYLEEGADRICRWPGCGCWRKRGVKDDPQIFGLSHWKDGAGLGAQWGWRGDWEFISGLRSGDTDLAVGWLCLEFKGEVSAGERDSGCPREVLSQEAE